MLVWCGCAFLCGLRGCRLCFLKPGGISCAVSAGASVLVRPIRTALTGRETYGGDPMV